MITFTEQEKAVILLGTASLTAADAHGSEPNAMEKKYAQFINEAIKPSQEAFQLYKSYFTDPIDAYNLIKNSSDVKKRLIKTFFIYMCTCDGPINEGEQQALDLLDILCDFPEMTMDEINKEYRAFLETCHI